MGCLRAPSVFFTTWPIGVGGQNTRTGQCDDQSSTQKKDIAAFSGSLLFNDENYVSFAVNGICNYQSKLPL